MLYPLLVMRPGNRLREMRKRAGLDQDELAAAVGATQPAISNLENGKRPLTIEWMRILARALNCSPADFLTDEDNPDRLSPDERAIVHQYRHANQTERETLQRVSAAVLAYNAPPRENAA